MEDVIKPEKMKGPHKCRGPHQRSFTHTHTHRSSRRCLDYRGAGRADQAVMQTAKSIRWHEGARGFTAACGP